MRPINNKPGNKQFPNFFTKLIQKYGEDFLSRANSGELGNGIPSLFRDLSKGRINLEKHGAYLFDDRLLDMCLYHANAQAVTFACRTNALNAYLGNFGNQMNPEDFKAYRQTLDKDQTTMLAYQTISTQFTYIKMYKNPDAVYSLVNQIRNYRSNF